MRAVLVALFVAFADHGVRPADPHPQYEILTLDAVKASLECRLRHFHPTFTYTRVK